MKHPHLGESHPMNREGSGPDHQIAVGKEEREKLGFNEKQQPDEDHYAYLRRKDGIA